MSEKLTEEEAAEVLRRADELAEGKLDECNRDYGYALKALALRLAKIEQYVGKTARPEGKI